MEKATHELLLAADDPEHPDFPPTFSWAMVRQRLAALKPTLDRICGRSLVLNDHAQDASFSFELCVQRPGAQRHLIETVIAIRFSNFGDLCTIWSSLGEEQPSATVVAQLVAAVSRAGFHYVPASALDEPYAGCHPAFRGATWWLRFFDYL